MKINWDVCKYPFYVEEISIPGRGDLFAQGPQSLKLKDRIRVYFSTRDTDLPGFFRSQVRYVDLDFELKAKDYAIAKYQQLCGLGFSELF